MPRKKNWKKLSVGEQFWTEEDLRRVRTARRRKVLSAYRHKVPLACRQEVLSACRHTFMSAYRHKVLAAYRHKVLLICRHIILSVCRKIKASQKLLMKVKICKVHLHSSNMYKLKQFQQIALTRFHLLIRHNIHLQMMTEILYVLNWNSGQLNSLGMLVILSLGVFIKMIDTFLNTPGWFSAQVMYCVCCHTQLVI